MSKVIGVLWLVTMLIAGVLEVLASAGILEAPHWAHWNLALIFFLAVASQIEEFSVRIS